MKTLIQVLKEGLKANGYDGLYDNNFNCACRLEDLAPCGEMSTDCTPGVLAPCNGTCEYGKCDFHIVKKTE